jgi:hypothetical protein
MKSPYSKALGCVSILVAILVGCSHDNQGAAGGGAHPMLLDHNPHRVVTISGSQVTPPVFNPCEVDFPVTFLRITKSHTIAWYASDHDYWIWFNNVSPLVDPSNPSNPHVQQVHVQMGKQSHDYDVDIPPQTPPPYEVYFTYAIFDADPGPHPTSETNACKHSSDERDTGVNVKR